MAPPRAGAYVEVGTGLLRFAPFAALVSDTFTVPVVVTFGGATPQQSIQMEFGDSIEEGWSGTGGTTSYAAPSQVSSQGSDGNAAGPYIYVEGETPCE